MDLVRILIVVACAIYTLGMVALLFIRVISNCCGYCYCKYTCEEQCNTCRRSYPYGESTAIPSSYHESETIDI